MNWIPCRRNQRGDIAIGKLSSNDVKRNPILMPDSKGKLPQTIEAFRCVLMDDARFNNIRFNELRGCGEIHDKGKITIWSDTDDAEAMYYLESVYGMYSKEKYMAALRLLFKEREYNPVKNLIEGIKWDGKKRCQDFLHKWGKCDNTPYVREISRLIFAGGIHRLYYPGCKFDEVPIFMGVQGCGKSTLSRWLAIDDDYHGELKFMEGQQAIEDLSGKWFMEIPEMSAFTKAKDQEAVKAFISRQRDQYRKPYDRNTTEIPRRCVFVASSNSYNVLVDKSGNRRWHPVEFHGDYEYGFHLYDIEDEVREYIRQCWAEAYHFMDKPYMKPFVNSSLSREITEAQDNAMQDDWRVGAIQAFLERKSPGELTCVRELFRLALYPDAQKEPSFAESKDIGQIMNRLDNWERCKSMRSVGMYGKQRCWQKIGEQKTEKSDDDFWEE